MKERLTVFTGITLDHIDKQRGLDIPETGEVDHWPSHITVSPPALAEDAGQVDNFIRCLEMGVEQFESFDIEVGSPMMVGQSYNMRATELSKRTLYVVHMMALGALYASGFSALDRQYSGTNYRPHITHDDHDLTLQKGSKLVADNLSVYVKQTSLGDVSRSRKSIVKRLPFAGR